MAYLCLLLIAILTMASGATPLYCSDVQSPASGSGHSTDLSQVTTLHYCIVDNCTIMRTDTGQQLDIVYTTENLLIVTPKDGHNSMVITKANDELPCLEYPNTIGSSQAIQYLSVVTSVLVMVMSTCTLIVHLLFKRLRNMFGKLLILYNLCVICLCGAALATALMRYWIIVNSQAIFHIATIIFTLTYTGEELLSTSILYHLAYLMYRCYNLKSNLSKKRSEYLLRCCTSYTGFTLILVFFVTLAYDWSTGNGKHTILITGYYILLITLPITLHSLVISLLPPTRFFKSFCS